MNFVHDRHSPFAMSRLCLFPLTCAHYFIIFRCESQEEFICASCSHQFLGEQDLIGNNTFLPRYSPSSSHINYSDEIFYSRQWNVRITYTLLLISIYPARSPVQTKYLPSAAHIPPTSHHPVCASCRDSGICHPLQPYGLRQRY